MTKQDIARKLVRTMQSNVSTLIPTANVLGAPAQLSGVSSQVDEHLQQWLQHDNVAAVRSAIELLATVGLLSTQEASELHQAVDAL